MNIQALLDTLEFSQPMKLNTKSGPRLLRKAEPTKAFWDGYREDKEVIKGILREAGIGLSKFREAWTVDWWSQPDLTFKFPHSAAPVEEIVTYDLPELSISDKLFEYQITSVQYGVRSMSLYNRTLLGHGTGMGKTAIALAIARERGKRVAVVCPKPIVTDWHRMAKYLGVGIHEACGWEWVKTGKSAIGRWENSETRKKFLFDLPPDVDLVFDEVHRAKGEATQNAFLLRDSVEQDVPTIALSATVADNPTKMWAIGQFLGLHKGGRDFYRFLNAHDCAKTRFGMEFKGGKATLRRIHKQVFPDRGNRLKPSDVGDAFPETMIAPRAFDMESVNDISETYEDLLCKIEEIKAQESAATYMGAVLAAITRARQAIELLKAPSVCAMAKDLIEEGNSVFIAVNYRETMEFIQQELKTECVICGGQNEIERRGNIDSFQNDKSRVIIGIIQACREGLNLHDVRGEFARIALIMPTFSVYDLKQVLGRVHRAGGKSKSIQYIVYAAGVDIEENICSSLDAKLKNMDTLMDGHVDPSINLAPKEE